MINDPMIGYIYDIAGCSPDPGAFTASSIIVADVTFDESDWLKVGFIVVCDVGLGEYSVVELVNESFVGEVSDVDGIIVVVVKAGLNVDVMITDTDVVVTESVVFMV